AATHEKPAQHQCDEHSRQSAVFPDHQLWLLVHGRRHCQRDLSADRGRVAGKLCGGAAVHRLHACPRFWGRSGAVWSACLCTSQLGSEGERDGRGRGEIGMKFAATIEYTPDKAKIEQVRPAHRKYLTGLLQQGKLAAAGPFMDDSGALIVYEA